RHWQTLAAVWENAPRASNGVDASAKMRDLRKIIVKLFLLLSRRHPFEHQLLHSGGGLREIDIAFGIGRDVMTRSKNPGRPDRAHDIESLAIDDGDTFVGADVKELLLRVGRQRQIPCKWRLGPDQLLYELAVVGKHLDASVLPICQVHHPVHAKRMRDIEMR